MSALIHKGVFTIIIQLLLTVAVSIISGFGANISWAVGTIMGLSAIKFILVGFQFMELKKAHVAWKVLFLGMLIIFLFGVLIALS